MNRFVETFILKILTLHGNICMACHYYGIIRSLISQNSKCCFRFDEFLFFPMKGGETNVTKYTNSGISNTIFYTSHINIYIIIVLLE